jgi:nicotinamide mononucleotide transporter
VSNFRLSQHAIAIALIFFLTLVTGWLTARYTRTPMPYLDAFTAWGSVVTAWMMARKVLENWLYWMVVDSMMVVLSWRADLPATTVLFTIYVGMAIVGFLSWRRSQRLQQASAAA